MNKSNRRDAIVRTGYVGIFTNIAVAAGKAIVGVASGSMAIVLDAVNNITDALSSLITIIGVKLAGRPADDKHPFGYGRIEYFTAVVIAALILVAGGTSLSESIKGILEPEKQTYTFISMIIIVATLFIKLALGIYTKRKGKELSSDSLISSGTECIYDCLVSVSTIISAIITIVFDFSLDSFLAAIIACLIIKAGLEMLMSPIAELMGKRSDPELIKNIKKAANKVDGVRGVYDVVLHDYGPEQKIGALHVEVAETMTASDLHMITRKIQQIVRHEFDIFVTVGFYAHNAEGTDAAQIESKVRKQVLSHKGALGMHGFYINHTDRIISFDIVYSFKVSHPISLRKEMTEWLQKDYKDYEITIGLDANYSEK